jgi:phage-related protein
MAKETTVEVDTKYTEKLKSIEEGFKKISRAASAITIPQKLFAEMEKYQQSIEKTDKLLKKLEEKQKKLNKLVTMETIMKVTVKRTTIEDTSEVSDKSSEKEGDKKGEKGKNKKIEFLKDAGGAINGVDKILTLPKVLKNVPGLRKVFGVNFSTTFNRIGTGLSKAYSAANSKLASGLVATGNTADKIFKGIGPTTGKIIENFRTGIKNAGSGIGNIFSNIGKIDFKAILPNIGSTISNMWSGSVSGITGLFSGMGKGIGTVWKSVTSFDYIGAFKGIGPGILNGIKGIGPGLSGMFSSIGSGISGAFSALAAANPLAIILILVGAFVLLYMKCESFRRVVNDAFKKIMPEIMKFVNIVKDVACAVFQELLSIFNQLKPALFSMLQKGKPLFEMLVNTIVAAIKMIVEVIQYLVPVFAQIWEAIKPVIMIALEVIIALIGAAIETITFILQLLIDVFQAVWDAIAPIVMLAIDIIVGLITGLIETISFIIQGIVVVITLIWEQIKPIFQIGVEFIINVWNSFKEFMGGLWSGLVSGIEGFANGLKETISGAVDWVKGKLSEMASSIPGLTTVINLVKGKNYSGTNFWKGGLTYVGERGRELIQYPTGERFMAEAKMLMNLPKGTKIFTNSKTEKMLNKNVPKEKMMTVDENNQLKKLGGFNGLSDYADFKFGGGTNYSNVQADNITINITNTYGNQTTAQIKDTNNDLVRKINEVLFQKEDRRRRVSIG